MVYTPQTKKAMLIAYNAHLGQVDKSGIPYIYHPIHLAEQMDTEDECIVALLHDVVEDTSITFEQLEREFSSRVINALRLLTRDKRVDYMDYVKTLATNPIARKVKLTDLAHNSDETRLNEVDEKSKERHKKYVKAIKFLKNEG